MERTIEPVEVEHTDRVEREIELDVDAIEAWEAISSPAMLERWLADEVELEPIEGTPATFVVDGDERTGRIERVREGRELCFTWHREPGSTSLVELELEPCVSGIRLRVTETSFDVVPPALMGAWSEPLMNLRSALFPVIA